MFLRVLILVSAATCCTARVIDISAKQSAWEQRGIIEGDIVLTEEQLRSGLINPVRSWPNKKVPFVIDDVFNETQRAQIQLAIDDYHNKTTIRFEQYDPKKDKDYIHITGGTSGCWSYVGRVGGRQELNLQRNRCLWIGTIIHELLHALGFYHQHSVTDRDDYVTINWQNIQAGEEHNFEKYEASTISNFGVSYDYDSIMHYNSYAFSWNELKTIEPKDPNATIGQRDGFSEKDIQKLEKMYENSTITEEISTPTTTEISSNNTEEISTPTTTEITSTPGSSYAPRSQFITLIIITLNVLTHLQ